MLQQPFVVVNNFLYLYTLLQIVVNYTKGCEFMFVKRLKEYQNKLSQRLNRKISPTDYVLIGKNGTNRNPDSVYRGMKRIIESKNLPISTTLHGLRHSHATMLLLEGVPVKVITERLGHASTKITQDIYMHVLPEMQDKAADVMDSILKPKTKPNGRRMVEVNKK